MLQEKLGGTQTTSATVATATIAQTAGAKVVPEDQKKEETAKPKVALSASC